MTVQEDTPATITAVEPDPAHVAALDQRKSQADKIRYACEQVPEPTTTVVRDWLSRYHVTPARSYVSSVVNSWRGDHGMAPTGGMPKLTPELLAELDAISEHSKATTKAPTPEKPALRPPLPPAQPQPIAQPRPVAQPQPEAQPKPKTQPQREVPDTPRQPRPRGWIVAWVSFVVGGLVSVAANVAHTVYPTQAQLAAWTAQGQPAESWAPSPGAMAFAAFWPIALILSVEVLTRVAWRPGFLFGLARYGGTTLVAAVAAVMSYRHMSGLLAIWGEDTWGAHLGPLAVDGLMVVAAAALLSMSRNKTQTHLT